MHLEDGSKRKTNTIVHTLSQNGLTVKHESDSSVCSKNLIVQAVLKAYEDLPTMPLVKLIDYFFIGCCNQKKLLLTIFKNYVFLTSYMICCLVWRSMPRKPK